MSFEEERQMRFLSRKSGLVRSTSRAQEEHRSARRSRRSPIALETLETRGLMSVPGVSLSYGNLLIQAPTGSSGNVAKVSIDPATQNVNVSFNGQTESFSAGQVANITYYGGSGGGDKFENDTNLVSLDYGFGAGNNFSGSTSYNFVYFFGAGNTYSAPDGSFSDVLEIGGGDTVNASPAADVAIYVY
jgi:hypothetical protein